MIKFLDNVMITSCKNHCSVFFSSILSIILFSSETKTLKRQKKLQQYNHTAHKIPYSFKINTDIERKKNIFLNHSGHAMILSKLLEIIPVPFLYNVLICFTPGMISSHLENFDYKIKIISQHHLLSNNSEKKKTTQLRVFNRSNNGAQVAPWFCHR